jgi:hypothetical protein
VDRATAGDASGVDDPVEAVRHGGHHGGDRGFVGDVGRHEREPRPEVGRGSQVGANDCAAFGQQATRSGQAYPRRRSCHDERAEVGAIRARHGWFLSAAPASVQGRGSLTPQPPHSPPFSVQLQSPQP